MFAMFNQFFNMLSKLFHAGENFATALDNVSEVAVIKSGNYRDEEAIKAEAHINELLKEHKPMQLAA